jgi:hypothetical protein
MDEIAPGHRVAPIVVDGAPEGETTDEFLDRIILEHGAKIAQKMRTAPDPRPAAFDIAEASRVSVDLMDKRFGPHAPRAVEQPAPRPCKTTAIVDEGAMAWLEHGDEFDSEHAQTIRDYIDRLREMADCAGKDAGGDLVPGKTFRDACDAWVACMQERDEHKAAREKAEARVAELEAAARGGEPSEQDVERVARALETELRRIGGHTYGPDRWKDLATAALGAMGAAGRGK